MPEGHVEVGGAPLVTELPLATVTKIAVGPMDNDAYLVRSVETGEAVLIDAADDAPVLLEACSAGGPPPGVIVITHRHADHWKALAEVAQATGARVLAGAEDAAELPVPAEPLRHGEVVHVDDIELEVIALRGHTPGSIALLLRMPGAVPHLFTGDSLFPGGVGKTAGPDEFRSLIDDVTARVFDVLPDETVVHPGHGDDTTLGAERPHLAEWRERGW